MDIVISGASEEPIYQQIVNQVSGQILRGELPGGICLPSIRTLALELRISVITVKRAWEELERAGFIYTMSGKGCFVRSLTHEDRSDKRLALIAERLDKDLAAYRALGVSREELLEMIRERY